MARKPGARAEFVLFDVFYEDGSQRSNRKVPSTVLGGLDHSRERCLGFAKLKLFHGTPFM